MKLENVNSKEKGITLVALVVTIIIMLILAGVTLNLAIGENGIIKYATGAKELYENSSEYEKKVMDQLVDDIELSQYVRNGLIVQYDAINNTGNGHSSDTKILKNLASKSEYDGKIEGATINSNCISFDGQDDYIAIGQVDSSVITIEMTVKIYNEINAKQRTLVSNTEKGGIALHLPANQRNFESLVGGNGRQL